MPGDREHLAHAVELGHFLGEFRNLVGLGLDEDDGSDHGLGASG
jgi:hypothetical protein